MHTNSSYPYPTRRLEQSNVLSCILPQRVGDMQTALDCRMQMKQCESVASQYAKMYRNPEFQAYTEWFRQMAHGPTKLSFEQQGQSCDVHGTGNMSCSVLNSTVGQQEVWPRIVPEIQKRLNGFHQSVKNRFAL
jgi:hypothetical protein